MNDKQSFLEKLTAALIDRGISEADIAPYIEQFDRFYDRMRNDDAKTSGVLSDVEGIADNIASQVSDRYDAINRLAERTMTVDTIEDDGEYEDAVAIDDSDLPTAEADIVELTDDGEYEIVEEAEEISLIPAEMLDEIEPEAAEEITESVRLPDYIPDEEIPSSKMFWILFGVSLPITIPLALAVLGVFALMWGGLAGIIVGAIAALVGVVTAGTALSLVGIIYGIVQLFTSVATGLYEIGIGIVVAGIVIAVGILLYNFAVRLMPILIKLVWRLFKYVLERLRELFNYLRKESAKL